MHTLQRKYSCLRTYPMQVQILIKGMNDSLHICVTLTKLNTRSYKCFSYTYLILHWHPKLLKWCESAPTWSGFVRRDSTQRVPSYTIQMLPLPVGACICRGGPWERACGSLQSSHEPWESHLQSWTMRKSCAVMNHEKVMSSHEPGESHEQQMNHEKVMSSHEPWELMVACSKVMNHEKDASAQTAMSPEEKKQAWNAPIWRWKFSQSNRCFQMSDVQQPSETVIDDWLSECARTLQILNLIVSVSTQKSAVTKRRSYPHMCA